jgi:hypothetical protein
MGLSCLPFDARESRCSTVSSVLDLGLSLMELSNLQTPTLRFPALPTLSKVRGLPPPTCLLNTPASLLLHSDPRPFALTLFPSTIPRSDSWHRFGRNFARAYIRNLPPGGSRPMFVFPVSRPFVCGCHNISTIPSARTIPGLPGSHTPLPHRVARTHPGTMGWNPTPSPP